MFFCPIDKTSGGASVTYVLMSIKYLRLRGGRFLPLQCVALIGGVSLCDEGVRKILVHLCAHVGAYQRYGHVFLTRARAFSPSAVFKTKEQKKQKL